MTKLLTVDARERRKWSWFVALWPKGRLLQTMWSYDEDAIPVHIRRAKHMFANRSITDLSIKYLSYDNRGNKQAVLFVPV